MWLDLVKTLTSTLIPVLVPGGAIIAPLVEHAISLAEAETKPGLSGADKLNFALGIVGDGIDTTNAAAGRQVIDKTLVGASVGAGISTVVNTAKFIESLKAHPATLAASVTANAAAMAQAPVGASLSAVSAGPVLGSVGAGPATLPDAPSAVNGGPAPAAPVALPTPSAPQSIHDN